MVLFQSAFKLFSLYKRKCPECRREQFVSVKKRKETVNCKFCRKEIPPVKAP